MRLSIPTDARTLLGALDPLFRRNACIDQRQLHVVQRRGARQQVEGLEDEANLLVADARQLVIVELADQLSVQPVVAFAGSVKAANQIHQCGFARTRRSHDGDILVALNADAHAAQRVHLLLRAHVVGLPQVFGADDAASVDVVALCRVRQCR